MIGYFIPNGNITIYIAGLYEARYASTGTLLNTKVYYAFGGKVVAMRDNSVLYYLHTDHLGSTRVVTDSTGQAVSLNAYYPFGASKYASGARPTDMDFTGQRLDATGLNFYNARYYDSAVGRFVSADTIVPDSDQASVVPLTVDFHEPQFLAQLNAENAFSLQHGFWFQLSEAEKRDAKVHRGPPNPQDLNRYTYVRNNPLRYTDPSGHCLWDLCIFEGIGLVEATIASAGILAVSYEYYVGPNAAQHRAELTASIDSAVRGISNGVAVLMAKGEYVPPGLDEDERNAYREAVHIYKKGFGVPPNVDVPKEILDQIAEAIKQGLSPLEAADQADEPPEPELDETDH